MTELLKQLSPAELKRVQHLRKIHPVLKQTVCPTAVSRILAKQRKKHPVANGPNRWSTNGK